METTGTVLTPLVHLDSTPMEDVLHSAEVDNMDGVGHGNVSGPATHHDKGGKAAARSVVDTTPFLGEDRHTPELWIERSLPLQQYIARANKRQLDGLCLRACGSADYWQILADARYGLH
jgi:hypothetical protein